MNDTILLNYQFQIYTFYRDVQNGLENHGSKLQTKYITSKCVLVLSICIKFDWNRTTVNCSY